MALYLGTDKVSVGNAYNIDTLLDRAVYVGSPEEPIEEQSLVADKLAIPRKIGNAEFDGSSDISVSEIGIPNPNLLDNSDFTNPVNQRGKNSFPNAYNHFVADRWKCTGNIELSDGKLKTSPYDNIQANGGTTILQQNEAGKIPYNGIYSISMKLNGQIYKFENVQVYARPGGVLWDEIPPVGKIGDNIRILFYQFDETPGSGVYLAINSLVGEEFYLEWIKLEKGDVVTPWQPKSYNEEYDECLRYFTRFTQWSFAGVGYVEYDGSFVNIQIPSTVRMRKAPTATIIKGTSYPGIRGAGDGDGADLTVTPTCTVNLGGTINLVFRQSIKAALYNQAVCLILNDSVLELSADL